VMVSSVLITWLVKLPIAWWLALELELGAVGAWIGLTAEIAVLAVVCWIRIRSGRWLENESVVVEEENDAVLTG